MYVYIYVYIYIFIHCSSHYKTSVLQISKTKENSQHVKIQNIQFNVIKNNWKTITFEL